MAPVHQRRGDQGDHEGDQRAGQGDDQHCRYRSRYPAPLQKSRRRRQHGADDEGRGDRKKERLGEVKHCDAGDHEQRHQRKRDHLGATDHRRGVDRAVRHGPADLVSLLFVGRWPLVAFRLPGAFGLRLAVIVGWRLAALVLRLHALGGKDTQRSFPLGSENGGCRRESLQTIRATCRLNRSLRQRFHRGNVTIGPVDSVASQASCREPCRPCRVDRARQHHAMRITPGSHHGTDTRRHLVARKQRAGHWRGLDAVARAAFQRERPDARLRLDFDHPVPVRQHHGRADAVRR